MTTKRVTILAGTLLGGILIAGTAGLALAAGPTADPPATPSQVSPWGMMGGQGMMGGSSGWSISDMNGMHEAMGTDGTCDPAVMQSLHDQYHSTP